MFVVIGFFYVCSYGFGGYGGGMVFIYLFIFCGFGGCGGGDDGGGLVF